MRILFAASEFEDFVRVGGLASVSAALTRALKLNYDVRVMLPGFRSVLNGLTSTSRVAHCKREGHFPAHSIVQGRSADGLSIYAIDCAELYERDGTPYSDAQGRDWHDNDVRFALLASAAARLAAGQLDPNWRADVVHANDWQTALIPAYLSWMGSNVPSLLTIHNLAYQGLFSPETLQRIGAPDSAFQIDGVEFYGKVSFLKAGIYYANHLTTVSKTYANEITTPEQGCGLEGLLAQRSREGRLSGILNGIDESWDPRSCSALVPPFAAGEWGGKQANADHVRREFGLALSKGPLFGLVARLVHQKGIDLVASAADTIVEAGGQIVITGRGEPHLERALEDARRRHPESIAVALDFDDSQARRIFAGSDFTLMPSRYEPCGLSQMYAQRFGSLPIGYRTGGLSDTIVDGKTGFLFKRCSADGLLGAVCRAFATFGAKSRLHSMRKLAMAQPFGWEESARAYRNVYGVVARAVAS
ncbi:MAG: glycogen synthase GlgA [Enhydrobacter sp.]|nr:glycogen synthase GlgA [Enhydrobacter sp.]